MSERPVAVFWPDEGAGAVIEFGVTSPPSGPSIFLLAQFTKGGEWIYHYIPELGNILYRMSSAQDL